MVSVYARTVDSGTPLEVCDYAMIEFLYKLTPNSGLIFQDIPPHTHTWTYGLSQNFCKRKRDVRHGAKVCKKSQLRMCPRSRQSVYIGL